MFGRLFPKEFNNAYRGHWLALVILGLLLFLRLAQTGMGLVDPVLVIRGPDGILFDTFNAPAQAAFTYVFRCVGTRALSGHGAADLSRRPRPARRTEGHRTALPDTARSGGAGRHDRSRHAGGDALGLPSVGARYTQEVGQLSFLSPTTPLSEVPGGRAPGVAHPPCGTMNAGLCPTSGTTSEHSYGQSSAGPSR